MRINYVINLETICMDQINPVYNNKDFGNKIMLFGGDFRQIRPVIKKGN